MLKSLTYDNNGTTSTAAGGSNEPFKLLYFHFRTPSREQGCWQMENVITGSTSTLSNLGNEGTWRVNHSGMDSSAEYFPVEE